MKVLNRFTTIPILLDILTRKKIFIPDYTSWEDKNDTEVLDYYLSKTRYKQIKAICFTHDDETIHHWHYFSKGSSGCCIQFNFDKLIKHFMSHGNFIHRKVKYYKISDLRSGKKTKLRRGFIFKKMAIQN